MSSSQISAVPVCRPDSSRILFLQANSNWTWCQINLCVCCLPVHSPWQLGPVGNDDWDAQDRSCDALWLPKQSWTTWPQISITVNRQWNWTWTQICLLFNTITASNKQLITKSLIYFSITFCWIIKGNLLILINILTFVQFRTSQLQDVISLRIRNIWLWDGVETTGNAHKWMFESRFCCFHCQDRPCPFT